jgi:hypothetical protein
MALLCPFFARYYSQSTTIYIMTMAESSIKTRKPNPKKSSRPMDPKGLDSLDVSWKHKLQSIESNWHKP